MIPDAHSRVPPPAGRGRRAKRPVNKVPSMTSTPGKPRGPYARTAERRRKIAQAVLDLVIEKGHAAVTTAEVAERSDTREATVMYHFPTKEHLLVAALKFADEQSEAAVPAEFDFEDLRHFVATTPHRIAVMRLYAAVAGTATTPETPAHEFLSEHYARVVEWFADLVRRQQQAGVAHPALDPVQVARQFVAVWDGLQGQWLVSPDFDLGEVLVAAARRLAGHGVMAARRAMVEQEP